VKEVYEKPVIRKFQTGLMNKFGRSPAYLRRVRREIDGHAVEDLVARFGSPLFVYSERTLRRLYRQFHTAFSTRYPNVVLGWSYKTNYLDAICAWMHRQGSFAEVVSEMEYQKARALGVPGDQIVFNGPYKPLPALTRAAREGAWIHIDHFDEICDLERVAAELGRRLPVGLRLNLDAGIHPQWSRFGFNLENGQALEAVKRIQHGGRLRINGLHCHLGTFLLETAAYAQQVEKMAAFAARIEETFGLSIEYLDLGGGFPSRSRLRSAYLPPELTLPSIDEYAETIAHALFKALPPGDFPKLVLESGRALVDEAGYLITTVVAAKRLPDSTRAYVVDAGVNLLYTSAWYKFAIEIDREIGGLNEPSVLHGPLCMNIDTLDESVLLPPLPRGTRLVLSPVGAYNQTQAMQFIHTRPAVVLLGEQGEVDLIREAEDLSDIVRRERLPARLARTGEGSGR
jgi:diaminopimelate decarboxylase